jgi:eukaryotic-like serine/threonine-protein kinase
MSPGPTRGAAGGSLARGARLGPYTIEAALGAGGMGEVWRARDTRLGRAVALKVLPVRFAQSPERLARLEREAHLLAALNHPHIATLYGLEESGGTLALVMELVEGATLQARLERGPLRLGEALELGRQIAEALEAAHEKGILHRDLKPANVRLTEKGQVKLLDFGLAKVLQPVAEEPPSTHPPSTLTTEESPVSPGTGVAGTAPYMSPEQARGEEVDRRSDVWGFGCVLYEMLAGRRVFPGRSFTETVAAVLEREPDWTALPRETPAAVTTLLERCLRKDREERLRDAGDARLELEELLQRGRGRARWDVEERSPYPGLRAFDEEDAGVFFGREREVEVLWARLRERRLLAVIGPSGAGKTSFLRAGVIPARPEGWGAVCATPGANPALGLARALTPELAGDVEAIGELLSGSAELAQTGETARVVSVARRWRARHAEALLVVDQFEELFTLNPSEAQSRFAALLGRLATDADIHVVLSLRDDFLMRCHEHESLAPVFSEIVPLGALTGDDLRRAVVEPASKRGYRFEDEGLVDLMIGAVEGARGALPLVAFAVARLWERRDRERKLLTREAYREIAGVEGALAQHAEATMDRIGPERQSLVRDVFRNLVTAQGTRAVIDREELLSAFPDRPAAEDVLRQLIDARLLTTYEVEGKEGEASHHRVEVVHESLLRAWPRLVRWQAQDEEGAVLRDQLKQAAHLWDEKGRTSDLLWTGTAFQEYELWRGRYPGALTALEEDFARAMHRRALQARRLRRAAVAAAMCGLAVVAAAIGVSRQKTVVAARRTEASRVLALGQLRLAEDPTEALAFATASLEISDSPEARVLAIAALWDSPPAREVVTDGSPSVRSPAFSPDGGVLAAAGHSREARVWRDDGSGPIVLPGLEPTTQGSLMPAWASPHRLVIGLCCGLARRAHVWSMPDGRLATILEFGDPSYWDVAANRVFTETPVGGSPETPEAVRLRSWALDDGASAELGRVAWRTLGAQSSTFAPDGQSWLFARGSMLLKRPLPVTRGLADRVVGRQPTRIEGFWIVRGRAQSPWTRDSSGTLREWTLATGRAASVETASTPTTASTPPWPEASGRWLVGSRMQDPGVRVWRRGGWPAARPLVLRRSGSWSQTGWATQPAGDWLVASTNFAANLTFWPLSHPFPIVIDGYADLMRPVSFSPDGHWLLTSWADRSLRLWSLEGGATRGSRAIEVPDPERRIWNAFALDPRGRFALGVKNTGQAWVVPLDGRPAQRLPGFVAGTFLEAAAVSPSGRFAVTAFSWGRATPELRVWDLQAGTGRTFELPVARSGREQARPTGYEGGVSSLSFAGEATLYTGGDGGVRRWDLTSGRHEMVVPSQERLEARVPADAGWAVTRQYRMERATECAPLVFHDLTTGASRTLQAFGGCVLGFEIDASGRVLVAGGKDGLVRVGRLSGGEPQLLIGHKGVVDQVAISPDLKWIASTGGDNTLRLWPMPDLDKPPLHTLQHGELLAKLKSLTNLRAIRDPKSATGWSIEIGPFPGWKDVPTW